MATTKEREEFISILVREFPDRPIQVVNAFARLILRHARTHGNIQVNVCNGPGDYVNHIPYPEAGRIYAEHEARCEKREAQIEKRIMELCTQFGVAVRFGGDPRGYTVSIYLPSKNSNSLGGRENEWGVPQ